MKEEQNAILITLSQKTISARRGGYRSILQEWAQSDGETTTWWYKLGTAPRSFDQVEWVYWVIGGRIRYRCRLAGILKDKTIQFSNNSVPMHGRNWLVLFDFEAIPRQLQICRQGFQGFRYFQSL